MKTHKLRIFRASIQKIVYAVAVFVLLSTQQVGAITKGDIECLQAGGYTGDCAYDPSQVCGGAGDTSTVLDGPASDLDITASVKPVVTDSKTKKHGQSLGGVNGTGFTQAEIDAAKAKGKLFSTPPFTGANDFLATTYGPPWDSVEGGGITSTGADLAGPDNNHGRPRYAIAVDPNVIPYGSMVTVWPNAVKWRGPFLAADTGGAIIGHHVDVYDWSGDGTKDVYTKSGAKVQPFTGTPVEASDSEIKSSDDSDTCICPAAATDTEELDSDSAGKNDKVGQFLKALAFQENGGAVTGTSSSSARGKFQYIDSTWNGSATSYYPPALKYSNANEAPEAVQDAVAYLEYSVKFKKFEGDYFKMALSHFYPVSLTDPGVLDVNAPGNLITPRQYANSVIKHMKNNDGKKITFKYTQAPEFEKYLNQNGGYKPGDAGGTDSSGSDTAGSDAAGSCQCSEQAAGAAGDKTIVIDPGHGPSRTVRDVKTGLNMVEQPGGAGDEIGHAWNVSTIMKKNLEKAGYKVLLTKKDINDTVTFRGRADIADKNNAALALSVHGDSSLGNAGEIYEQKVGLYRGTVKTVFNNEEVAKKSHKYAEIFKEQREKAGGGNVVIKDNSFDSRGIGMEPGNIPMVQLLSSTPWVYNEKRIPFDDNQYAKELEESVKKAVPLSGASADSETGSDTDAAACATGSGSIMAAVQLAMTYSWASDALVHGPGQKPIYTEAVRAAKAKGWYTGGLEGNDCGGFITIVMRTSGADPEYNKEDGYTVIQQQYMDKHPEKYQNLGQVSDVKDLRPGDIGINSGHTFMYVGPTSTHPDFHGDTASASYSSSGLASSRAPGALELGVYKGHGDGPFTFYRLKDGG